MIYKTFHISLLIDFSLLFQHRDSTFDFCFNSWQEMADYDLPAMINYVLHVTGQKQLFYVGHSQGTMIAFNGFSNNLSLGNKVKAFFALAPVYTLNNTTKVVKVFAEAMCSVVKVNFDCKLDSCRYKFRLLFSFVQRNIFS